MAKSTWKTGVLWEVIVIATCVLVGATGGARSPWLVAFAPAIFLLAWFAGPVYGLWGSAALSVFLMGMVLYVGPHLPAATFRQDIIAFTLIGLATPLGSTRWLHPALRRRRVMEQLEWHETLSDLVQSICFCQDLETALDLAVLSLDEVIAAPRRAVLLHDRASGELRIGACLGMPAGFADSAAVSAHQGEVGRCLEHRTSLLCLDNVPTRGDRLFPEDDRACTYVLIPLSSLEQLVGALYLSWPDAGALDDRGLRRLEEFADSAALALDRLRNEKELRSLAMTDGLTSLYNYRMLQLRLPEEASRALRQDAPLSFLMFDLDDFKSVNDRHGHLVGDQALRAVAHGLREACRGSDIPVRYAGDEFAVLCPGLALTDAGSAADRIRQAVERSIQRSTGLDITLSMGIAAYPETNENPEALLEQADRALYTAKSGGRARTCQARREDRGRMTDDEGQPKDNEGQLKDDEGPGTEDSRRRTADERSGAEDALPRGV
ncbi:MAG TPA: sensor domain-containing diguanylate cyclase [Armatimonadota bacterium]|nr:sensor domain-containing diguanylate cyclase [Armatimonadota bacterium]